MKYLELTIRTTSEASELVADVLWNYTEGGVALSDYADVVALQSGKTGIYWDYLDEALSEPRSEVLVKAFLSPSRAGEIPAVMREIYACRDRAEGALDFGTLEESTREIEGDDWVEIWKKHFRPIHIGRVVVVPEWIGYTPQEGEAIVLLDSNMAFGTGEHETTAMCLALMQDFLKEGDSVLDIGCGSGILGIAAARLGAKRCRLTDIDPVAVASAGHNARKNGVEGMVTVSETDLAEGEEGADIIFANITAEILIRLAPTLPAHLKEGGTVILSGILEDRLDRVKEAFAAVGLHPIKERKEGAWCALALRS